MKNQIVVKKGLSKWQKYGMATVAVTAPAVSFAADAPDVSEVVSYLGLAVAAIGAIGAAKMIPAAATWLWSTLSGAVKRG